MLNEKHKVEIRFGCGCWLYTDAIWALNGRDNEADYNPCKKHKIEANLKRNKLIEKELISPKR